MAVSLHCQRRGIVKRPAAPEAPKVDNRERWPCFNDREARFRLCFDVVPLRPCCRTQSFRSSQSGQRLSWRSERTGIKGDVLDMKI